ncbi:hypothetical protein D9757_011931 [Collybiopsis confluens]|uniref:Uncharacterized protein n=1 Tax=Collybiopsis confluens TaxID=2823264 RepID=A0A8H5LR36_9AGAR|nr:hypothetical protein D9757_011931 [Collybiopsis confluens]
MDVRHLQHIFSFALIDLCSLLAGLLSHALSSNLMRNRAVIMGFGAGVFYVFFDFGPLRRTRLVLRDQDLRACLLIKIMRSHVLKSSNSLVIRTHNVLRHRAETIFTKAFGIPQSASRMMTWNLVPSSQTHGPPSSCTHTPCTPVAPSIPPLYVDSTYLKAAAALRKKDTSNSDFIAGSVHMDLGEDDEISITDAHFNPRPTSLSLIRAPTPTHPLCSPNCLPIHRLP